MDTGFVSSAVALPPWLLVRVRQYQTAIQVMSEGFAVGAETSPARRQLRQGAIIVQFSNNGAQQRCLFAGVCHMLALPGLQ